MNNWPKKWRKREYNNKRKNWRGRETPTRTRVEVREAILANKEANKSRDEVAGDLVQVQVVLPLVQVEEEKRNQIHWINNRTRGTNPWDLLSTRRRDVKQKKRRKRKRRKLNFIILFEWMSF